MKLPLAHKAIVVFGRDNPSLAPIFYFVASIHLQSFHYKLWDVVFPLNLTVLYAIIDHLLNLDFLFSYAIRVFRQSQTFKFPKPQL
jgi:hypothetical protein